MKHEPIPVLAYVLAFGYLFVLTALAGMHGVMCFRAYTQAQKLTEEYARTQEEDYYQGAVARHLRARRHLEQMRLYGRDLALGLLVFGLVVLVLPYLR